MGDYDFSEALKLIKTGVKVMRRGWNGNGFWVELRAICENPPTVGPVQEKHFPYLEIAYPVGHAAYPEGCRVPWLASQTDILAEDWMIF